MGEYVPRHIPERIRRPGRQPPQTVEHRAARRAKVLGGRQPGGVAELVAARRIQLPRGHDPAPVDYTRRRSDAPDRKPAVARRDGGAVPRSKPDHFRRTAFDIGEWGLGFMTTSLELGCDCLGEIRYLDAVLHDSAGEPNTIPNAICIRGGQRRALEARRPRRRGRGAADAPVGGVVPRDRRQLRVPGVLASLPGRQHRVRGAGHGIMVVTH